MTAKLEPVRDPAYADFLDRVGIVLRGVRQIAQYMGVSPATIVRWRTRFRGREEVLLCFPAMLIPTGKGWGFQMISHTALIQDWIERWAAIDAAELRGKKGKTKRLGETSLGMRTERESASPLHEEPPERPCPCSRCSPHLHPEQTEREPVYWTPPVIPEPSPEPMRTRRPEGCTCGTGIPCAVCDK